MPMPCKWGIPMEMEVEGLNEDWVGAMTSAGRVPIQIKYTISTCYGGDQSVLLGAM